MKNNNPIINDWRKVGDDMRVAFGMKKSDLPGGVDTITATLEGVRTLNVCGTRIRNR